MGFRWMKSFTKGFQHPTEGAVGLHKALQGKVTAEKLNGAATVRGMCFRLSYKWIATTWQGQQWKAIGTNMDSTFDKQMEYLKVADTFANSGYPDWFRDSNNLSKTTLITWGAKHGLICGEPDDRGSVLDVPLIDGNEECALVIGFFGTTNDNKVWGHATAFLHRAGIPLFFDINVGVATFDGVGSRCNDIFTFVNAAYCKDRKVENFVIYRLDK